MSSPKGNKMSDLSMVLRTHARACSATFVTPHNGDPLWAEGRRTDSALVLQVDRSTLVIEEDPAGLVDFTRMLYLAALRAAGRDREANLLENLNQRAYEPDASIDELGDQYVVDLYGLSLDVVPAVDGLRLHVNTDDAHRSGEQHLQVDVDGTYVGTYRL
jgi:hypothetical protein